MDFPAKVEIAVLIEGSNAPSPGADKTEDVDAAIPIIRVARTARGFVLRINIFVELIVK